MYEVAKIYHHLGEEPGVLKWSKKATQAFKALGKLNEQVAVKHNLMMFHLSKKKFEDALEVARSVSSLFTSARDKRGEAMAKHWIADVQIKEFLETYESR